MDGQASPESIIAEYRIQLRGDRNLLNSYSAARLLKITQPGRMSEKHHHHSEAAAEDVDLEATIQPAHTVSDGCRIFS